MSSASTELTLAPIPCWCVLSSHAELVRIACRLQLYLVLPTASRHSRAVPSDLYRIVSQHKKRADSSCILLGAIVISFYTVERFGRRALTLIGGVGSLLFNVLLGVFGLLVQTSAVQSATLAMICLWVVLYAICFAGSGWTVASEIATPRLRAKSTAFIVSTNAISGAIFVSNMLNPLTGRTRPSPSCSAPLVMARRAGA